jgi:SPP1 family predicted phage head-tail adaptor
MAIEAGRLRHKPELQEQQTTQDSTTGEMVIAWVTIAEPWAAVEPASVSAFIAAAAQQSEVRGQFVIRHRENINATMRFLHRGLAYRILGVLTDKDSGIEYMTLPVSEGVRVVG